VELFLGFVSRGRFFSVAVWTDLERVGSLVHTMGGIEKAR
jgi:hypothetical protein